MALSSRSQVRMQIRSKWKDTETSPERTKIWTEPAPPVVVLSKMKSMPVRKLVSVVYYLSRNGQLEHPHFMEVALPSSSQGLCLRDVVNRLNSLRGNGMASMYSWSSKRSYKNGFMWQDLSEHDLIHPTHGKEYVLKGSEILLLPLPFHNEPSRNPNSHESSTEDLHNPIKMIRRRNQSWSPIDLHEYKVYKSEYTGESAGNATGADVATQTDDMRQRRKGVVKLAEYNNKSVEVEVELSREDISPPPSDSSPETIETIAIKPDQRLALCPGNDEDAAKVTSSNYPSVRMKASSALMQLISCGAVKDQGISLISHYKARVPRGAKNHHKGKSVEILMENHGFAELKLEDKEYFSGSLIQTKKDDFVSLKRSASYNTDRSSHLELAEKDMGGMRAKCIPRKPKTMLSKKEASDHIGCNNASSNGQD